MPEQGYYGTESNPWANLYSERRVMTVQTSGGSLDPGEYRLRTDLNSGDRIASYELNVGNGVETTPIYPVSMSTDSEVAKVRHVYVPGEGWGFVPLGDTSVFTPPFEEFVFWHNGTRYGWHDSVNGITDTDISQEEDGDISEWSGETGQYSVASSPTISGSDNAIGYGNDGSQTYIDVSFDQAKYPEYSFHVYPENANNEIIFWDSSDRSAQFCIYFRANSTDQEGIYYSEPTNANSDPLNSVGNIGTRDSGVEIVSPASVSVQYYQLQVRPNWGGNTVDVYLNGSEVLTGEGFLENGEPDRCRLTSNFSPGVSRGYVDKIEGLSEI